MLWRNVDFSLLNRFHHFLPMWQIRNQNELLIRNRFDVRREVRFKSLRKAALDGVLTPWWLCVDLVFASRSYGNPDVTVWRGSWRNVWWELNMAISATGPPQPMQNNHSWVTSLCKQWQLLRSLALVFQLWSVFSNCFVFNFLCPADHRPEEANGDLGIPVKNPPEPPPPRSVSDDHHNFSWQ